MVTQWRVANDMFVGARPTTLQATTIPPPAVTILFVICV
jgi:hypothetical protein